MYVKTREIGECSQKFVWVCSGCFGPGLFLGSMFTRTANIPGEEWSQFSSQPVGGAEHAATSQILSLLLAKSSNAFNSNSKTFTVGEFLQTQKEKYSLMHVRLWEI